MDDEVPILDEENYSTWRIEMRVYLKTMGETIHWWISSVEEQVKASISKRTKEE